MKNSSFTLFIEINKHSYVFFTCKNDEQNNFKIIYRLETTLKGIENNKISDLGAVLDVIKNIERFIIGEKKPKDHWKKYRKPKK